MDNKKFIEVYVSQKCRDKFRRSSDKAVAKIKRCSFFAAHDIIYIIE